MKFKLILLLKFLSKLTLYGLLTQCLTFSLMFATEINAQKYKSVKEVEISVQTGQSSINDLFDQIESQTNYRFSYDKRDLNRKKKVGVKNTNQTVAELLLRVSESSDLKFRQVNDIINVKSKKDSPKMKPLQIVLEDIAVQGKVTDDQGEPLPGASVIIKQTGQGTVTDIDGNYKLTVAEDATLVFSFIGYGSAEIDINRRGTIDIQLFEDLKTLQEVVVVGYGTTLKKDLTGTVASIESKDLMQIPSPTIDQSLVGKMTGVHVSAVSGKPGAGSIVNIRGMSQVRGDNQPLYVVDGVPVVVNPQYADPDVSQNISSENPLLMINPNDVERIDVLKDASAAAIYGSRAANGVVLITTKRGKAGQAPRLSFNVSATIQNPNNEYDYLNASEWKEFSTTLAETQLAAYPPAWHSFFEPANSMVNDPDYYGSGDTDWQDLITNKDALWMEYGLNYTGSKDNVRYSAAINVTDMEGIMLGNEFERYGFRMNLDSDLGNRVTVGSSFSYNYTVNKSSAITALNIGKFRPDLDVFDDEGEYTTSVSTFGYSEPNPLGNQAFVENESISQNLFANVYAEINIINDLSFRSDVSISVSNDAANRFEPSFTSQALLNEQFGTSTGALLTNTNNATKTSVFTNRLIYNTTFNDVHKLNANIGIEWNSFYTELGSVNFSGFPDDEVFTNINSATDVYNWRSTSQENGLNSLFARINYGYSDKYLATFTVRRDGSNKFGPNDQYGIFPSGAIAWNAHNESFLEGIEMINTLKIRASMGRTGSDNLPPFGYLAYAGTLVRGSSTYGPDNSVGITSLGIPNPDIKWETTDQMDIGLEFGLFNNRLSGEIVYFEKKTSDLIMFQPLPFETGGQVINANVGDVSNKGWEVMLSADIIRTKDLRWNSSLNLTSIDNKVDALNGGQEFSTGASSSVQEGHSLGTIFGYEVVNIAQTQEEIDALNAGAPDGSYYSPLSAPGDYVFRDVDGDGEITRDGDRVVLGDIIADYYGGWNNTVSYKNLQLTFNFQYSQGGEKYWADAGSSFFPRATNDNALTVVKDMWSDTNTEATYARIGSGTHDDGRGGPQSKLVFDASYIRLRTLGIAYSLPKQWSNKFIKSARIYFNANNIWTSTSYPGLDPESTQTIRGGLSSNSDRRNDRGNYPLSKSFTIGLNVGF